MQRKIFIAVNPDPKTKRYIANKVALWKEQLPLKWSDPDDYHITVHYQGFIEDEKLADAMDVIREQLEKIPIFDLEMLSFGWGPNEKKPKMLWLKGKRSPRLISVRQTIESVFSGAEIQPKPFEPHITLGRLSRGKIPSVPAFMEKTRIIFPVNSIDIMESVMEKGKRRYYIMEQIGLT